MIHYRKLFIWKIDRKSFGVFLALKSDFSFFRGTTSHCNRGQDGLGQFNGYI